MFKKILFLSLFSLSFFSYANSELERIVQAQGQLLTDSQQKINNLQDEVDQLRGQLEETTYQLNQTIERQKIILQQLNNTDSKSAQTTASSTQNNTTTASSNTTLSDWSSSGDDKTDYNFIIKFVMDGKQPKEAISALQQFVKDYPKSTYLANANYWLGQLCYQQNRKDDASFYYATVVKNYPKSAKAADSLYKIGVILLDKNEKLKAKAVFQQVINQYPNDKNTIALANNKLALL